MVVDRSILYLGSRLPCRSETFVYREVLKLRERKLSVAAASVRPPEFDLGADQLDQLAKSAIPVYGSGLIRLMWDAFQFAVRHPVRSAVTGLTGALDAFVGKGVSLAGRPKILVQCVAGLALAKRCQPLNVQHVHAHMAHVPTTIAMYTAMALQIPFSFTGHAADLFRDFSLLPAKLKRAKFICCISRWHRDFYKSIWASLNNSRLPIVRCGVDM